MVRFIFILCAMHDATCHNVDPLYQPMPVLTCDIQQTAFFEQWAQENPEPVADQRFERAICVPVHGVPIKA